MSIFPMDSSVPVRSFNSALTLFSRAGFFSEIMLTSRSQAKRSRPPIKAVMRTIYRSVFFNTLSEPDRVQVVREFFQDRGRDFNLFLCLFPIALFDGFPDARQCFYAISGIKLRSINSMPVPGAAREPLCRYHF